MPTLSIVIPTRNRPDYLVDCVNVALEHCPGSEIVVCDNSDTDGLRALLSEAFASGRVVYDYSGAARSVVDNFEHALSLATGDYLMFLGDDDCVGPGLPEIVDWAAARGVEAVVSYRNAFLVNYFWPGVRSKYFGGGYSASLFVSRFTGGVQVLDTRAALRAVAGRFGGGLGEMARAYHGLVGRPLLDRIRGRHGHVFGGVSPDIFSGALISAHCKLAYIVDYPFVIPGASRQSTAGQGAERSDRGGLKSTEHTARFGDKLVWDKRIPEFYSPQTVWALSLQRALDEVPELQIEPSYGRLYARCLLCCRPYWEATLRAAARSGGRKAPILALELMGGVMTEVMEKLRRIVVWLGAPGAYGTATRYEDLPKISAAYDSLVEHIVRNSLALRLEPGDGRLKN